MRRAFIGLALVVGAWLACLGLAGADTIAPESWGHGLDLTAAQQARVRSILTDARAEADGVEADRDLCPAEKKARYAAIERSVDLRLFKMLTPPQQDRFAVLHPDVMERLQAPVAAAAEAEPQVDGGIGSGPAPRPTTRRERDDPPVVADDDSDEPATAPAPKTPQERPRTRERDAADRPAISLPLPTFNVNVKMGGIPVPIPISLPPVQIRL